MRAIDIIDGCLQATECPLPDYSETEVLIKVVAAGVNRADIMQRQGLYPPPKGAPDILGLEVSGIVSEIGSKVSSIKVGDSVCALLAGGGYAEYCVAHEALCLPLPSNLDFIQAASLPEAFFTVWSNVFNLAKIKKQETLLVHGGSSGIGVTAIQLAKAFGINVIVTAGSQEKCDFCLQLGADAVINYREKDFVSEVRRFTEDKGVDVILDMIGGDYLARNIKCMTYDARLVQIAIQKGYQAEINLLAVMLKRLTITGSTLRDRDLAFKRNIAQQLLQQVWGLIEKGSILPVIDQTFSLEKAGQAHQRMEAGLHKGKIILTVS